MSSVTGKIGVAMSGTYCATKHSLHGYFESLRTEKMAEKCVHICFLCPGPVFSDHLKMAATENPGETLNQSMKETDKRMKTDRCARLMTIAISNHLKESWIMEFPVLPLLYTTVYMPSISKRCLNSSLILLS